MIRYAENDTSIRFIYFMFIQRLTLRYGSLSAKIYQDDNNLGHEAGLNFGKQRGNFVFETEYFDR